MILLKNVSEVLCIFQQWFDMAKKLLKLHCQYIQLDVISYIAWKLRWPSNDLAASCVQNSNSISWMLTLHLKAREASRLLSGQCLAPGSLLCHTAAIWYNLCSRVGLTSSLPNNAIVLHLTLTRCLKPVRESSWNWVRNPPKTEIAYINVYSHTWGI